MTIYFLANDFRGRVNYVVVEVLTIIHYYRMLAVLPLIHLTTKQENINLPTLKLQERILAGVMMKSSNFSPPAKWRPRERVLEVLIAPRCCLRCPPNDDDVSEIGSRGGVNN